VAPNEADLSIRIRGNYAYTNYGYGLGGLPYPAVSSLQAAPYATVGWSTITSGSYAYTGHDLVATPRTRIAIDPNVRVRGNGTYAGFEDVDGAITLNEQVEVYEPESGLTGSGRVTDIDADRELVFLSVEWSSLAEEASPQPSNPSGFALYMSAGQPASGHDWMELSEQPGLAYVTAADTTLQVTATARGWWAKNSLANAGAPYLEISQPYAGLNTSRVVVA
jgi:hypothetical protein